MIDRLEFGRRHTFDPLTETVFISDLHIDSPESDGIHHGRIGRATHVRRRFDEVLSRHNPARAVIVGDVFHHENAPRKAVKTVGWLASAAANRGTEIILVKGNHDDGGFGKIERREIPPNVQLVEEQDGECCAIHGHKAPETKTGPYVCGHLHPMIGDTDNRPCFLHGRKAYRGSDVLFLPPFNDTVNGVCVTDYPSPETCSPLIRDGINLDAYHPLVATRDSKRVLGRVGVI